MISTQVLAAGKIYTNIGKVAGRSRTNITQKFYAQQKGMWQLTGCAVVELDTDEEWIMPNLLDVVVVEASDGVATPLPAVPERSSSSVFTREASPKPSQPDVFASPSDAPPSTNSSASNLLDLSSAGIAAQETVFAAPPPADRLYVDVTTTPPPGAVDTGAGLPAEPATPPPPPEIARAPMPSPDPLLRPPPPPLPAGDLDLFGSDIADHSFMAESAVSEISAVSPVPTPPRTLPAPPFAAPPIPEGQTIIPPAAAPAPPVAAPAMPAAAPPQTPPAAAADLFPDDPLSGGGFAAPAPAAADLFGPAPT